MGIASRNPPYGTCDQDRCRRRRRAAEDGLPPADYPQLRGLADTAEMRAVAAIEEGCIAFGLASLREAQRLRRAWRMLRDWLEWYPEPEGDEPDPEDWDEFVEEIVAMEEGRAPVYREPPPQLVVRLPERRRS